MSTQPCILIMDEDAETLEQLQTVLRREGYRVAVAVDGNAALRLARTAKPQLIVSDLLLASLDGYEVWKILRADKEMPRIPILVTSALTIPPSNELWRPTPNAEWQLLSYDAFLPKPLDLRRLVSMVKKLLHPDQSGTIPGGPSVILAIEDQQILESLAAILRHHDFGVKTSTSIPEALRLVRAVPPAALILDYRILDQRVRTLVLQANKFIPNTVIILVINPDTQIDADLQTYCDGFLRMPLHPIYTVKSLKCLLEFHSMRRRTAALSTDLITTNRNLLDTQQMLQAQNEELQYINAQLRELDDLKEIFTSMVVHDLKSPLGSVLGTLNFLLTDPNSTLSSINESLLTGAIAAGHQMLRLIETLLEGQRLEDGHLKPDTEPFDFSTITDACLRHVTPLITLHGLEVNRVIADDLPLIYADPHISQRILENLMDNAIKFSPPNGKITIRATLVNQLIEISIEDEGPGIPKEQQKEIFNRFAQLKQAAQSSSRAGFGLGLTFCHLAIEAMGGSIWVESDGETGTMFIFTLPAYQNVD